MTETVTTNFPVWHWFWEDLERMEVPWSKALSEENVTSFEVLIESMVRTSIPALMLKDLQQQWISLRLPRHGATSDPGFRWNMFPDDPNDPTEATFLRELMGCFDEDVSIQWDVVEAGLPAFIKDLKHAALHTSWQFLSTFAEYTATLPSEVIRLLSRNLYSIAVIEILSKMA